MSQDELSTAPDLSTNALPSSWRETSLTSLSHGQMKANSPFAGFIDLFIFCSPKLFIRHFCNETEP